MDFRKVCRYGLILLVLAVAVVIVYAPSLHYQFTILDDENYLVNNPSFILGWKDFIPWAFKTYYKANWHPLTWLSWRLDYSRGGFDPYCFRLSNIILHALNTWAVFALVYYVFKNFSKSKHSLAISFLSAVIFAIHPVHIESVVWVSERKDLLYSLFYLISLLLYLRYVAVQPLSSQKSVAIYLVSIGSFLCAILSKPMAMSLPAVIVVIDFFLLKRLSLVCLRQSRCALFDKVPFILISLFSVYMTLSAQGSRLTASGLTLLERSALAAKSIFIYLGTAILPLYINPLYPLRNEFSLENYLYLFLLLFLVVLFFGYGFKKNLLFVTGLTVFLVNLIPVLGFVQMGYQERADRYVYLALIIPVCFIASGLFKVMEACYHRHYRCMYSGLVLLVVYCGFLLYKSATILPVWENTNVFTRTILDNNNDSFYANFMRAKYHLGQREFDEANHLLDNLIVWYEGELQHSPLLEIFTLTMTEIYFLKGMVAFEEKNYQIAIQNFDKAIASNQTKEYVKQSYYYRAYCKKYTGNIHGYFADKKIHGLL